MARSFGSSSPAVLDGTTDWNAVRSLKQTLLTLLVSAGISVGLMVGVGSGTANADVLDELAGEYSLGSGAGQVANLLNQSIRLRSQGFAPKRTQYTAISDALSYRPNQTPLVQALQAAVTYQSTLQAQAAGDTSGSASIGVNQCDFNNQWNSQQGGIDWPPNSNGQEFCNGPFSNGGGVVIGGGQTISGGTRFGNGR